MVALSFRSEQHLICVVAGLTRERLLTLAAPGREITLAIPLPAMANGYAPTVIMPPNEPATLLFRRGGDVIPIADPQSYRALGTSTAIMACYFAFAGSATNWLMRNRVPENVARNYISSLLQGLSQTTQLKVNDSFQVLENHHATPGSFNDTLRIKLTETGTFQAIAEGLDTLMKRMEG
jgi:pyrroline-5-carboxylate reductase